MKLKQGQIVEVNGKAATVVMATKTMILVEMDTLNGTVRKGISRDQVAA